MLTLKIFEGIDPLEHATMVDQFCEKKLFVDTQTIVEKGRPGHSLYIVLEGKARVRVTRDFAIDFDPGDAFGEICLIDGGVRTASVFSVGRCEVARLDRESFERFQQARPEQAAILMRNLAQVLAARLRKTDEMIRDVARELASARRPASLGKRLLAVVSTA